MAKGAMTCPACDREVVVYATCVDGLHATVTISSDCPSMVKLQGFLYGKTVDVDRDRRISGLQGFNYSTNTIYSAAERTIKDASCMAIPLMVRVVEVAAGVAAPSTGTFTVTDEAPEE